MRQAAQYAAEQAKRAEQEAAASRQVSLTARAEAEAIQRQTEQEQRDFLRRTLGQRATLEDQKRQIRVFLERRGLGRDFDEWEADSQVIAALRQDKGAEWITYERGLRTYAADLRQFGGYRDAMVRQGQRHLTFLFEAGAKALGHASALRNPARLVVDGVRAWLRIEGGEALVQRHRAVIGWLREAWATLTECAIEEPQKGRGRER